MDKSEKNDLEQPPEFSYMNFRNINTKCVKCQVLLEKQVILIALLPIYFLFISFFLHVFKMNKIMETNNSSFFLVLDPT